jgi:GTP-binding protein EngB required for normal cell division
MAEPASEGPSARRDEQLSVRILPAMSAMPILAPELQDQLNRARHLLAELRDALTRFGATESDEQALTTSIRQLDEVFLLVVVGEFNSGKSAFINALIGANALQEGVTPTTSQIHLLKHGPSDAAPIREGGVQVMFAPSELLADVHIVDTPGTNAIFREHERLTSDFIPRADMVLFVTSADRPFTESERAFLAAIRGWGKKIVIILNKVDIFERHADLETVRAFVTDAARGLLGVIPEIFAVSARLAQRAKHGHPESWAASGFEPVEHYVRNTLDERSRFRLKLANPLGVGQAIAARYAAIAHERLLLLKDDLALLEDIDRNLAVYRDDMRAGFELRMTAIEKVLVEMEGRGHAFFEDTLRVGRIWDLLNRSRVQKEFEELVVANAPEQIERRVMDMIDWLVDHDFRQWQAIASRLVERTREHERMLGAPEVGSFHVDRSRMTDSVGREAQRVVDTYDKRREATAIADYARAAVTTAAAAGGAAVGLGTLVTIAASTAAADVTGIAMAGVIATLGFLVFPARRRRAKREMQVKITDLRQRLASALRTEFERAQAQSATRIGDAVEPYSRFVRAEHERWQHGRSRLCELSDQASAFIRDLAA